MRRFLSGTGRLLITLGLLVLLFVAFELWGTDVLTARAQDDLRNEFCAELESGSCEGDLSAGFDTTTTAATTSTTAPTTTTTTVAPPPVELPPLQLGDPLGRIQIPDARHVDDIFVVGTDREQLSKGPGHYANTPLPGQRGNAAIAGHRTTYGRPFYYLDEVRVKGDPANPNKDKLGSLIFVQTFTGTYVYEVIDMRIVEPGATWVAGPVTSGWIDELGPKKLTGQGRAEGGDGPPPIEIDKDGAYLTLTTCNPRFSARERLVVFAQLYQGEPKEVKLPNKAKRLDELPGNYVDPDDAFASDTDARAPAQVWGFGVVIVGLLWWWAYRRWRHPATWFTGVLPFLAVLAIFYYFLERSLPAGY